MAISTPSQTHTRCIEISFVAAFIAQDASFWARIAVGAATGDILSALYQSPKSVKPCTELRVPPSHHTPIDPVNLLASAQQYVSVRLKDWNGTSTPTTAFLQPFF
jgi:hypothetical protein